MNTSFQAGISNPAASTPYPSQALLDDHIAMQRWDDALSVAQQRVRLQPNCPVASAIYSSLQEKLACVSLQPRAPAPKLVSKPVVLSTLPPASLLCAQVRKLDASVPPNLRAAISEAVELVAPASAHHVITNCLTGFASFATSEIAKHRLANAMRWLALQKACDTGNQRITDGVLNASYAQAMAAAAIEMHDIASRERWELRRSALLDEGLDSDVQSESYGSFIALCTVLAPQGAYADYAPLAALWVRFPSYLHEPVLEQASDLWNVRQILNAVIKAKPNSLEDALAIMAPIGEASQMHAVLGDCSAWDRARLAQEFRLLTTQEKDAIQGAPGAVQRALGQASQVRPTTLRQIAAAQAQRQLSTKRKANYAKLTKPDEGGASEFRVAALQASVALLQAKWPRTSRSASIPTVFGAIQSHIHECHDAWLDKPNDKGHTPRQKAEHALLALRTPRSDASFTLPDRSCTHFSVIDLVWRGIATYPKTERAVLLLAFTAALSRCLKDEEEALGIMPSIDCSRGYTEQLVLILCGYERDLPAQKAYDIPRARELFYELGPTFNEQLNGRTPNARDMEGFHRDAMRRNDALLDEVCQGNLQMAKARQDERRKALIDLFTLCREMSWPTPSKPFVTSIGLTMPGEHL